LVAVKPDVSRVLIVTNEQDLGADLVVLALERRDIEVLRCNTERLTRWRVTVDPGKTWKVEDHLGRSASSETTSAVWWRRPEPPTHPTRLNSASKQDAFASQWQAALEGFASVPGPRWVSAPAAIRGAEDKAAQLAAATRLGFRVPRTVWTNDAVAAKHLCDGGQVVAKTVTAAAWEDDHGPAFVFAHLLSQSQIPNAEALSLGPVAFQQPILPKRDVRVTVVGRRALSAIAAPERGEALDWRLDPDRSWAPHELNPTDANRCVRLVDELGLRFGGIDLAIDDLGEVWFLELNPNGEWGWLAEKGELPIVEALVDELTITDAGRG
jgi:hypothetical protein